MRLIKNKGSLLLILVLSFLLTACGSQDTQGEASAGNGNVELESVKLVLNWFAKNEHAGQYAALEKGYFKNNGLDVMIDQGGPQVSSISIVASGKAEFGLAHADQILLARNEGVELVSFATTMQHSPQAIMYHEGEEIEDFEDLNGRDMYVQAGVSYWEYLKSIYDLSNVRELNLTGEYANFIGDKSAVSQSFITQEPISLEAQGVKLDTKLISDSGYDPYTVVLFTTKEYFEQNPETVKQFVSAFVQGWKYYSENSDEVDQIMLKMNPGIEEEELTMGGEMQKEYIFGGDAVAKGFGYMTKERWQTLINQLSDIGLLKEEVNPSEVFTTELLPSN